jgi:hypothetical protein
MAADSSSLSLIARGGAHRLRRRLAAVPSAVAARDGPIPAESSPLAGLPGLAPARQRPPVPARRDRARAGDRMACLRDDWLGVADEDKVVEIRQELGFDDLARSNTADEKVTKSLVTHLPKVLERTAENWKKSATDLGQFFTALREEHEITARSELLIQMKEHARAAWDLDFNLGW